MVKKDKININIKYWTDSLAQWVANYSIQVTDQNWIDKIKEELDKVADTKDYIKSLSFEWCFND